jgi:hypothetical protein
MNVGMHACKHVRLPTIQERTSVCQCGVGPCNRACVCMDVCVTAHVCTQERVCVHTRVHVHSLGCTHVPSTYRTDHWASDAYYSWNIRLFSSTYSCFYYSCDSIHFASSTAHATGRIQTNTSMGTGLNRTAKQSQACRFKEPQINTSTHVVFHDLSTAR